MSITGLVKTYWDTNLTDLPLWIGEAVDANYPYAVLTVIGTNPTWDTAHGYETAQIQLSFYHTSAEDVEELADDVRSALDWGSLWTSGFISSQRTSEIGPLLQPVKGKLGAELWGYTINYDLMFTRS